jgi:Lar family restriction alleviation protein
MSEPLIPCPFCGKKNIEIESVMGPNDFRGLCLQCGARSVRAETKKEAAAEWNNRPGEDAARAEGRKDVLEILEFAMKAFDPQWPGACHQDCFDTSDGHGYEMQEAVREKVQTIINQEQG